MDDMNLGDMNPVVKEMIEDTVILGVIDKISVQSLDAFAETVLDGPEVKAAVLECLAYVLSHELMILSTFVDGRYIPYAGDTAELIQMVSENYLYDDEREPRGDDYTFLYWMLNTEKGDELGKRWLDEFHRSRRER